MKTILTIFLFFCIAFTFGQTKEKYDHILDSLIQKGETDEKIISYFLLESKAYPNNEFVLRNLGYLYIGTNQLEAGEKYYLEALKINPECARCYMNIARVYATKNDRKKAIELLDKSIKIDPKEDLAYFIRAKIKDNANDRFGALFDFNKAIELNPKNASYIAGRGEYNYNQNYLSLALSDMNHSIEIDSTNYYSYYLRSMINHRMQLYKEALEDINAAIQLDSNQQDLYVTRGVIYNTNGDYTKSVNDYTKAITLNPKNSLPYYNRSLGKYSLEDMDGSCSDLYKAYEILKKNDPSNDLIGTIETKQADYCDSSNASYYYQRGIAYYNLKLYEKAVQIYSNGLKKIPNNTLALQFRGNAYLELKDYANAIADYNNAIKNKENIVKDIELNPNYLNASVDTKNQYVNGFIADTYLRIAKSKFALLQYDDAMQEINKGIAIAENYKEGFYNFRGFIFIIQGKYQQAINDYDKCIQLNPSFPFAYVNRALAKYSNANQTKTTSFSIGAGISKPNYNPHWTFSSKTKANKSDLTIISALDDCNKAIELEPTFNYPYYIRGQLKKMLDMNDYCYDLLKAKNLGYPLESNLLNDCGK